MIDVGEIKNKYGYLKTLYKRRRDETTKDLL